MKLFIKLLPASALILLFSYAAISKLNDFNTFKFQLSMQPVPSFVAVILTYFLPAIELVTVALLSLRRTYFMGLQLSLSLLLLFTGYISLVIMKYWDRIPCSCGGILNTMSWQMHLYFNLFWILINLIAIKIYLRDIGPVKSTTVP